MGLIDFSNETPDLQLNMSAIHWPNDKGPPVDSPPSSSDREKGKPDDPTGRNNSIFDTYKGLFEHLLL